MVAAVHGGLVHRAPAKERSGSYRRSAVLRSQEGADHGQFRVFEVVVVGGGPSGATAAHDLAKLGRTRAAARPCRADQAMRRGDPAAVDPRFRHPDHLLVARVNSARMVSPSDKQVDMPIDGGFVGMVDREIFDEWLRTARRRRRARRGGPACSSGSNATKPAPPSCITRSGPPTAPDGKDGSDRRGDRCRWRLLGRGAAMPARRGPAALRLRLSRDRSCAAGRGRFRWHALRRLLSRQRFTGLLRLGFPAWRYRQRRHRFGPQGIFVARSVGGLRDAAGLDAETIRREGAPIPLQPLPRWDDGHSVLLAGDAAGVVAPASGEGIYYAMIGGRLSAEAVDDSWRPAMPGRCAMHESNSCGCTASYSGSSG